MAGFSIWHWLIVLFWLSSAVPAGMILRRLGFSQWLAIFFIVPIAWIVAVWALAFARWPVETDTGEIFR